MTIPDTSRVTTSTFKNKGFLCGACRQHKPIVTRIANDQLCNECLPPSRKSVVTLAED